MIQYERAVKLKVRLYVIRATWLIPATDTLTDGAGSQRHNIALIRRHNSRLSEVCFSFCSDVTGLDSAALLIFLK